MAEINIWTNRALTDEETAKIESLSGFECLLDYDDFSLPEKERGRGFANYFFGVENGNEDAELLEIYNDDWAAETAEKIERLKIEAIYRVS